MTTVIIDYGSGNLRSAEKAFARMSAEMGGAEIIVSADPDRVARADRVVLPGVGAFADCRRGLLGVGGMFDAVAEHVTKGKPFLGICVGMQLMATRGLEHEETPGFDWVAGDVVPLTPSDPDLKVPHMGWNELELHSRHALLDGIEEGAHAYFVHSYHLRTADEATCLATCSYGQTVTAIIGRDNIVGTQFHPEKSQETGLRLIANFLGWAP